MKLSEVSEHQVHTWLPVIGFWGLRSESHVGYSLGKSEGSVPEPFSAKDEGEKEGGADCHLPLASLGLYMDLSSCSNGSKSAGPAARFLRWWMIHL